jgi:YidC/Oxa1 family membrane protein insertase
MLNDFFETWKNANYSINLSNDWRRIVFYSEGPWITKHLSPLIRELVDNRNIKITFLTSAKDDNFFIKNNKNLKKIYIGDTSARTFLFRKLSIELMVMSTPSLQSMQLKRQKESKYYYIHHSPMSTHMIYQENAFDNFDGIFCVGPYHIKETRERERKFSLKKKNLLKSGYCNFDDLINNKKVFKNDEILIASSWGDNSIVNTCLMELISKLTNLGFNVTFRPHYMSFKKDKKILNNVISAFKERDNFKLDLNPDSSISINNSKILITDWSGIAFEYFVLNNKPILFVDTPPKINNKNYNKLSEKPLEVTMRNEIGETLQISEIKNLDLILFQEKVKMASNKALKSDEFISKNFFNIGRSVDVICDQILELIK